MLYLRVLGAIMLTALTASAEEPFRFKSKREDDKVTAKVEKERTVIDVTCPTGISTLKVERTGDMWPENVVVRLRVSGLERFFVEGGGAKIRGNVASRPDYEVFLSVEDKKADPKDPKNAYYMDFKTVGKDGKPAATIPNHGGYFEFRLPKPLFEGNPKSVSLEWVDFLRR